MKANRVLTNTMQFMNICHYVAITTLFQIH